MAYQGLSKTCAAEKYVTLRLMAARGSMPRVGGGMGAVTTIDLTRKPLEAPCPEPARNGSDLRSFSPSSGSRAYNGRIMKVLVIEDSDRLRRSLCQGLEHAGFAVDQAEDGAVGLEFLAAYTYDVVILDLMLPRVDGLEVLRRLRSEGNEVHVLILSAKDQVDDRVRGLDLGADDYLVKPFSFDELCARLQALVRRRHQVKNPQITIGPLLLDTARRQVERDGEVIHLTPSEYALLELLCLRAGRVLSQGQLLEMLYRSDADISSNVIEVLISSLRRKIQRRDEPPIIQTRRGHGYLVEAP